MYIYIQMGLKAWGYDQPAAAVFRERLAHREGEEKDVWD